MGTVEHVTSDSFKEDVLNAEGPVLVDFMADWCPPCRAIGPELEAVAKQVEGRARIVKLNVDHHPDIEAAYGVRSIPTLIIFKAGQVVDTINGLVARSEIARKLVPHI